MIETLIAVLIAGGVGYYYATHMKKSDEKPADDKKTTDPVTDACNAEFDKMPAEGRSQVLAALKEAQAKGGVAGAAVIKSAADLVRIGYPAAAKCLDDAANVMSQAGGKTDGKKTDADAADCKAKLSQLPAEVQDSIKTAMATALTTGGKGGADVIRGAANTIRVQYPEQAACLDQAAADIEKLPAMKGLTLNPNYAKLAANPDTKNRYQTAPQTQGAMPPISMKKIIRPIGR